MLKNILCQVTDTDFEDENDAKIWIIRNQFGRRNLGNYVRCELALKLEEFFKEKAKKNKILSGKNHGKGAKVSQNSAKPIEPVDTRKEVAKAANISHDTVAKVKVIEKEADEKTKEKLRNGETTHI